VKADARVSNEQEKVFEVVEADAIVDPRAMMIHLQNARSTNTTMMAAVRLELPTPLAITPGAQAFLLQEYLSFQVPVYASVHRINFPSSSIRRRFLIWNGARMCHDSARVARKEQDRQGVENTKLNPTPVSRLLVLQERPAMACHVHAP
jgi:hypothetical protein